MKDPEIIRNKAKIEAIIHNAQDFKAIEKQYGSFQKYLDSLDKSNNYENVVKDLVNKFKWLGPSQQALSYILSAKKSKFGIEKPFFLFLLKLDF